MQQLRLSCRRASMSSTVISVDVHNRIRKRVVEIFSLVSVAVNLLGQLYFCSYVMSKSLSLMMAIIPISILSMPVFDRHNRGSQIISFPPSAFFLLLIIFTVTSKTVLATLVFSILPDPQQLGFNRGSI